MNYPRKSLSSTKLLLAFLSATALINILPSANAQRATRTRRLLRPMRPDALSYFPALRWRATLGLAKNTAPVVADLDGDGALDVVVPAVNGGVWGREGKPALVRLSEGGGVVWRYDLPAKPTAGATLGDVDRNGTLDILLACDRQLLCFDARGQLKWKFSTTEPIESVPTLADIDGDGKNEVIFGANDGYLRVLNAQGKQRWSFKTRSWITGGVSVANLAGDGALEIAFGSMDSSVYCLDAKGKPLWKYETEDWVASAPAIGDVDADGFLEIVALSDDGNLYCLSRRGTLKWKTKINEAETRARAYPALADLDGDGSLETLVYSQSNNALRCLLSNGDPAWSFYSGADVAGSPLVVDLNGDGYQEIVIATTSGEVIGLSALGARRFSTRLGQKIVSTPALGDFDRDGKWEIYVANLMSEREDAGFLSAFELSTKGGRAAWANLKGDPYRTGLVSNARDYGATLARGGDYATAWEPFGAGVRPRTGVQAPRRLRVSLGPLDDARGNRDGALDAGETAWVRVRVENFGRGASYDNLLKLGVGSGLKLDRNSAYLGWLAPGATKTAVFRLTAPTRAALEKLNAQSSEVDAPFVDINAPIDEEPQRVAGRISRRRTKSRRPNAAPELVMTVAESGTQAAVARARVFAVPSLTPKIQIVRRQIIDSKSQFTSGNGNGKLDAGESVILRLLVKNTDLTTATRAVATLSSSTKDVLPATPSAPMTQVVPFGGRTLNFSLRVAKRPSQRQATLKLSTYSRTTGGAAPTLTQLIRLPIGGGTLDATPPQIVLESPKSAIFTTRASKITLRGRVVDASPIASLFFERRRAAMLPRNRWAFTRNLKVGENVFPVAATDAAGNGATRWIRVIRRP